MLTPRIVKLAGMVLQAQKAVEIRNISAEEKPFLYSSGNWGPIYITIKGLVSLKRVIKPLITHLAVQVVEKHPDIGFVAGNATGGMVPGWILSETLEDLLGREVPYVYVRGTRKKGGHQELIAGLDQNPEITPGMNALVVEELVNFAETTCNSAIGLREAGFKVSHATTILFYENPKAIERLQEYHIEMIHLLTLPEVLEVAEQYDFYSKQVIEEVRAFLKDPLGWQEAHGLEPVEGGGTK